MVHKFYKKNESILVFLNPYAYTLSGHSFRVGAALDLLDKNIPLEKIMLRGGWKSETSAMRYLQSWSDHLIVNHCN